MPRTIEHKIRVLDRPATPPQQDRQQSPQYGTISRAAADDVVQSHFPSEEAWMGNAGNGTSSNRRAPEKPVRQVHSSSSKRADEVTYGTESFERNLRYSPNEIERQHFSSRSFGEQRSLGGGGDGESRASVRFEDDLEPARPIDHTYDNPDPFGHPIHRSSWSDDENRDGGRGDKGERLLHRSEHLDTTPIRIPRPKVVDKSPTNWTASGKEQEQQKASPTSFVGHPSRNSWRTSSSSSGFRSEAPVVVERQRTPTNNKNNKDTDEADTASSHQSWAPPMSVPMKKIIRKSRWVSIHDGRPKSKFVETVHYEPAYGTTRSPSSTAASRSAAAAPTTRHAHFSPEVYDSSSSSSCCSFSSADEAEIGRAKRGQQQQRQQQHYNASSNSNNNVSTVYVSHNPLYSIGL